MAVRLIALDVDGTLLTSAGEVSPAVRAAIREAVARGVHVTLATGRRLYAARVYAEVLGFRLPLILHGGAVIQESSTGAVLYEDAIPPDVLREVGRDQPRARLSARPAGKPGARRAALHRPLGGDNRATREYLITREGVTRTDHATLPTLGNILSVAMLDDELPPLLTLRDALVDALGDRIGNLIDRPVTATASIKTFALDLFNAGCGKGKALAHLARQEGITLAETMVVGDYLNDLEMLTAVRDGGGIAVAMGNAEPELKAVATATVATNDNDGVAEAIHRFVLQS